MGQKEWSPTNVLDVFGDSIARATLILANEQPVAVKDLATELNVSAPTIYRRINPLVDANLLKEHQRFDQQGNQHKEYETLVEEITFTVTDDGYAIDIEVRHDLMDDFESMWSDLERSSRSADNSPRSLHHYDDQGGDLS